MTEPRGPDPTDDGHVAALRALDLALDRLAGRPEATTPGPEVGPGPAVGDAASGPAVGASPDAATGRTADLAALAAELRAAVPPPPPGAAERGRAAFLAQATGLTPDRPEVADAGVVGPRPGATGAGAAPAAGAGAGEAADVGPASGGRRRRRGGGTVWRRSLPLRVAALAAALVVLVAVPAAVARQARPGTALWPLRQVGQQVRLGLADDPVRQAHLRLNTAGAYLAAGAGAGEERREEMADRARDEIREALDALDDVAGPQAAAERARAERLLAEVEALEDRRGPDDSSGKGPGSEPEPGDDRSGRGGGDDRSGSGGGDDRSGSGSDDGSGSGGGSSGSGSGSESSGSGSGSGTSGSGDD